MGRNGKLVTLDRRSLLGGALVGGSGLVGAALMRGGATSSPNLVSAASASTPAAATPGATRVLLAYFSRAGENYYYGGRIDLEVGNTEVLAGMIGERIDCDVYRIEAADPYSDDYEETVARNVREQDADARPAIANPLASIVPLRHRAAGQPDLERPARR